MSLRDEAPNPFFRQDPGMTQTIGIDVGGVIIDKDRNDNSDTSLFGENYLNALAVPGAQKAIMELNTGTFKDRVCIVSKCGPNIQQRTMEWLRHTGFLEKTGIPEKRVLFCRDRNEKAPIAKSLGLTHFVDDKLEVLHYMFGIVPHRMLFRPSLSEMKRSWGSSANGVQVWMDWPSLAEWLERKGKEQHA